MAKPKGKNVQFSIAAESKRVVSLGGGEYAYIFDQNSKTHHVKRDSDEMILLCKTVDTALGGKIRAQLENLGWTDVIERMDEE